MSLNRKRLDRIAKGLTPKQAILAWSAERRTDSLTDRFQRLKQCRQIHPVEKIVDQLTDGIRESLKGSRARSIDGAVLKGKREFAFLYFLHNILGERVAETLAARTHLALRSWST